MTQGIMLVTKDCAVPVMNRQCARLLSLPEELLAKKPSFDEIVEFQHRAGEFAASNLPDNIHPLDIFGPNNADGRFDSYERTRPDGTVIEVRSTRLEDGGFVRTFSDITQRRQAQAQADKLAAEDSLTGLANRRMLTRALDLLIDDHGTGDTDMPKFAVLYLDLDRFKTVNDTQGHAVGDQLLRMVAERLRDSMRAEDFIARLGGDEFAIILPLPEEGSAIDVVANRLVDALSRPYELNGLQLLIGASIGVAIAPRDGRTSSELLISADLALYAAKSAGRGTFRYFSQELNQGLKAKQEIESELRKAIADEQLDLHYQPIISLKSGSLIGFEALARWTHPTLGMIPPDKFIPIAEDSGLIQILGRWALETACRQASSWPDDLTVAVNLSPLQFADAALISTIERILASTGLAANRLEIEVTEGLLMKNTLSVLETLKQLKTLGVRIAMDDFGTGYSSLAYLQRFDFDRIKVDRCFVNRLGNDSSSDAIVRAVIDIAASRGMHTTAEGVETETQRANLTALGCDEAQGYLFSRPIAATQIGTMIARLRLPSQAA
ncbi:MAG: EAL domain-containing protein [Proteobacteria bacterium]|nr:EAL domain-containing protein [Pseudomonadota bacterium]